MNAVGLSCGRFKLGGKYSLKALFFVLVVQHHDWYDAHRALAAAAHGHLALQILQEAVGKTVQGPFAPGILRANHATMRTSKFNLVFLWVAVQCRPACRTYAECFSRLPVHGTVPTLSRLGNCSPTSQMLYMACWMQIQVGKNSRVPAN